VLRGGSWINNDNNLRAANRNNNNPNNFNNNIGFRVVYGFTHILLNFPGARATDTAAANSTSHHTCAAQECLPMKS